MLEIGATQNLGRYLGAPVLHGRVTKNTYDFLIDRLNSRLAGWKAENISLTGRVTLASSVLNSLPCYIMQTALLPVSLCDKIDRKIRSFIWGSGEGVRKIHNVNWDTVCKPKDQGGLGLRSARDLNKAFLMKLAWSLISRPNELWAKVLISKYMTLTNNGYMLARTKGFSSVWRGIMKVWQDTQNGIHWSIRDGRNTKFWTDRWLDSGVVLIDHAISIQGVDPSCSVLDFCSDGSWNLQKLRSYLPENLVLQVFGMSLPREGAGADTMVWGLEANGRFSVKKAYYMLREIDQADNSSCWKSIWKWEGPNKVRHFLWLASHNKLMTNVERSRRRLTNDTSCSICGFQSEDLDHVLRRCPRAAQVWNRILPDAISTDQDSRQPDNWLVTGIANPQTKTVFGITAWILWRARNQFIFDNSRLEVEEIVSQVLFWVHSSSSGWKARRLGREAPGIARQTQLIGRRLGAEGCFTLNTDGSFYPATKAAAAGGILRDDQGHFVSTFASNLGSCSVVRAEIFGVVEGMSLAWEKGIRRLRIQSDSAMAVSLLSKDSHNNHQFAALVERFKDLIARDWEVTIEHIYREANMAADFLANAGHGLELGTTVFSVHCIELLHWLHYDLVGVSIPRNINNTL
ncbi:Putative ribonuclease H protein At1g65750 [Linum perenne]